jgi:hypothetical protein
MNLRLYIKKLYILSGSQFQEQLKLETDRVIGLGICVADLKHSTK